MQKFDLNLPLVCEGIIGDGCGGGRIFFIKDGILKAYDPQSEKEVVLLEKIENVKLLSKKACTLFIECQNEKIEFDLPSMKATTIKI
ncbi:MAG: thiamine biosynthesis protein ThiF [Sulfurimonas sp.]|nr:thiamine biosynthesis protein ThiF [Sulfurimonas sp.]